MTLALVLFAASLLSLAVGLILLRSVGPGYRVGRLLAATPTVSIDDAIQLARGESPRYVRVNGRISSDEEFPDDQDRPLVFRRTRIEVAQPHGRWRPIVDEREAVPFGVETRSSFIAVDDVALGYGLVVIPRESTGTVGDLPADLTGDVVDLPSADVPARLVIEQLSAVEQATVLGQPVLQHGRPTLTAGLRRPLVVTTLEQPSAMRVLAHGKRNRVIGGGFLLVAALGLLAAALVAFLVGA